MNDESTYFSAPLLTLLPIPLLTWWLLPVINATNAASIYLIGAGTDSTTGTIVDCSNDPYGVKFVGPFNVSEFYAYS